MIALTYLIDEAAPQTDEGSRADAGLARRQSRPRRQRRRHSRRAAPRRWNRELGVYGSALRARTGAEGRPLGRAPGRDRRCARSRRPSAGAVAGSTDEILHLWGLHMALGQFLTPQDPRRATSVCVIGWRVRCSDHQHCRAGEHEQQHSSERCELAIHGVVDQRQDAGRALWTIFEPPCSPLCVATSGQSLHDRGVFDNNARLPQSRRSP